MRIFNPCPNEFAVRMPIRHKPILMRRHLILSIALISFLSGCSKEPIEWRDIGYTPKLHFYVSSVVEVGSTSNPYVGITTLWDFNQTQTLPEGNFQSSVIKFLVDCDHKLASAFSLTRYAGKMASGSIVHTEERDLKEAKVDLKEIGDPVTKAMVDYVCEIKMGGRFKIRS